MDRFEAPHRILAVIVASVTGLVMIGAREAPAAQILYDVDFSSPLHTVGAAPAEGAGPFPRSTVSRVIFEPPKVVASSSGLTDQPLEFQWGPGEGSVDYDQIDFDLGIGAPGYDISFDLSVDHLEDPGPAAVTDTFTVFLDNEQYGSSGLRFVPDADTLGYPYDGRAIMPFRVGGGSAGYDFDTPFRVRIFYDVENSTLDIWFDAVLVRHADFAAGDLRDVRMSLHDLDADGSARVAVDNLLILATPEPSSLLLLWTGLLVLTERRHRTRLV